MGRYRGLGVKGKANKPKGPTRQAYTLDMEPLGDGQWEAALTENGQRVVVYGKGEEQAISKARRAMLELRGDTRMSKAGGE